MVQILDHIKVNSKKINSKNRIVILICYFGKFPWYFHYFLHSCKFNSCIDFIIITDNNEIIKDLPSNIKIKSTTFEKFKQEVEEKFGFSVYIDYPYKLCDFKPTYGYLFTEFIESYDFWGHGDIDIIFGNIRNFMTDEVLTN
jgi:hypothetical protein